VAEIANSAPALPGRDPTAFVRAGADGTRRLDAIVDNIHCAGCVATIEKTLRSQPGVREARVNLTTRRLGLRFDPALAGAGDLIAAVEAKGYRLMPYDREALSRAGDAQGRALLTAMAVAGFAAANVMLLSVSVWAGLGSDMGPATRALMQWISALIALPAVAYAGMPFYRSAFRALAGGRLNMDVPISLAVVLAAAMSLYQTATGGAEVYFDAAVTLLFFLLIGRYLDSRVRARARSVAENLMLLRAIAATEILADGRRRDLPIDRVAVGMVLFVGPGDRVPADGRVRGGRSDADESLITGESVPRAIGPGDRVFAGALNLTGGLEIEVLARD